MAYVTAHEHGLNKYLADKGVERGAIFKQQVEIRQGRDLRSYVEFADDFFGDAGDSLPVPWTKKDVSASGSPTIDYVTNVPDGVLQAKHDGTSEAQEIGYFWNDYLAINLSKKPILEVRMKMKFASGGVLGSADQRLVVGVGSKYASALDNVITHAWFRIDGANAKLLLESDDGTNDNRVEDTGTTLSDDTWTRFLIDFADLSDVKFYVDGNRQMHGTTVDMSNVSADTVVQPFMILQRDAGAEQEDLRIDYAKVTQERS